MGAEKKVYSFRLTEELIENLKLLAEDENRPLSNLVETILMRYFDTKEVIIGGMPFVRGETG